MQIVILRVLCSLIRVYFSCHSSLLSFSPLSSLLSQRMTGSDLPVPILNREDAFNYDSYLFDADGTLWHVVDPHPGAIEFLRSLLEMGKKVFIVTNNAIRSAKKALEKLENLGFKGLTQDNIVTPNTVLIDFIKRNPHFMSKSIYLIGTDGLKEALEEELGVECFGMGPDPMPLNELFPQSIDIERKVSSVVVSDDPHFSYMKMIKAANYLLDPNCGFFVTNEDATFHTRSYALPGTGCLTAALRLATLPRIPEVMGKPGDRMAYFLIHRFGIDPSKTLMIGDRLDTDIKFGNVNGFDTCWVRTGVHNEEDVRKAKEGEDESLVPNFTLHFEDIV